MTTNKEAKEAALRVGLERAQEIQFLDTDGQLIFAIAIKAALAKYIELAAPPTPVGETAGKAQER